MLNALGKALCMLMFLVYFILLLLLIEEVLVAATLELTRHHFKRRVFKRSRIICCHLLSLGNI